MTDSMSPGRIFGPYRIESTLGRGGMSVVYLAEHTGLKRKVALKVLAPQLAEDEGFRERFIRESQIAASIDHPNVIPVYEAGEWEGQLFIAMRYVEGMDLRALLRQAGALDPPRTVQIIDQVAAALDTAHERGLVHRDIKPGNILLSRTIGSRSGEHVYLADFGLTKRSASDSGITGTGQFVGTLDYAAPEQFEGKALDRRTDVYSLGCVLFECLTGHPPFRRGSDAAVMYAHLHDPPPSVSAERPDLPPAVDTVTRRALAKRPDQRYPAAGDLAAALREAQGDERAARLAPGGPPPRSRAAVWIAAAVVVLGLGVAIAVVASTGEEGPANPTAGPSGGVAAQAPPPGSLLRLDADSGSITLTVPHVSGMDPASPVDPQIDVGEGGVWLYGFDRGSGAFLQEVDPETGATIGERITVSNFFVGAGAALAAGSRTVSYSGTQADGVARLNPSDHEPLRPLTIAAGTVTDLVLGDGVLWVGSTDGTLTGFDALTGRRLSEIRIDAQPDELAFGAGSVWAMDVLANEIVRVDPRGGDVIDRITVNGSLKDIAAGDGGVWVLDDLAGTVTQIDPDTMTIRAPLGVGPHPSAIAVGLGDAWVTDAEDVNLYRIDPVLATVTAIDIGAPLVTLAVDDATRTIWLGVSEASE